MMEDMFGDFQARQEAIQLKLEGIFVKADAGDGAILITANGNGQITNVDIDKTKLDLQDTEQLEDLFLVAVNRCLELAHTKGQEESQNMMKDLLPPGLDNLF